MPTPKAAIIATTAASLPFSFIVLPPRLDSAEDQVLSEAGLARLLVLGVHVLAGVGQGLDRGVEIDAMARGDLVGGDHHGDPGLHRSKGAALDTGHLDVARYRIAGHA